MKKVKGIIISILISFLAILMMPFSVYAYSISQSNILGTTVSVENVTVLGDNPLNNTPQQQATKEVNVILRFEVTLDKEYLGYITGEFTCRILAYDVNGNTTYVDVNSGSKSYYVSGYSLVYYISQKIYYNVVPSATLNPQLYNPSFTLAGSNVHSIDSFSTLASIEAYVYDIFTDVGAITTYLYDSDNGTILEQVVTINDILNDVYDILNVITGQLDDVNLNLEAIEKFRQYNVPICSWNFVSASLMRLNLLEISSSTNNFTYEYPAFIIPNGYHQNYFCSSWVLSGEKFVLIYGIGGNLSYDNVITTNATNSNSKITNELLYNYRIDGNDAGVYSETIRIIKKVIVPNSNTSIYVHINNDLNKDIFFVPIVASVNIDKYVTDDFKQQFGLVDLMPVEDLDDNREELDDNMSDLFDIEDNYGSQLNDQLDNIDFTNPLQNNFSMLSSSNFVIQVFNGLIANNPLSILIIIVCIFFVARRLFG